MSVLLHDGGKGYERLYQTPRAQHSLAYNIPTYLRIRTIATSLELDEIDMTLFVPELDAILRRRTAKSNVAEAFTSRFLRTISHMIY
ncbi:hypothetical protein RRF57_006550 [Xylaria bambusicola]|uniref:Uncharacterized protein n=1 Tax=Xylaria bambusicola TaxID=326684 RepID=A0AAN7UEK8_9PEZI